MEEHEQHQVYHRNQRGHEGIADYREYLRDKTGTLYDKQTTLQIKFNKLTRKGDFG